MNIIEPHNYIRPSHPKEECYVIFAKSHGHEDYKAIWWNPNGTGYTTDLNSAGKFTKKEAEKIVKGCHRENFLIPLKSAEKIACLTVDFASVMTLMNKGE